MKKYDEYKDSSIEWIGEIPTHWKEKKLKYVASINDEVLPEKTDEDYEIEYVEISGVKSGTGIVEIVNYRFKDAPSRARRIVRNGDILVSTVRTYLKSIAKVDNPPENLIVSTGFAVIRSKNIDSDYIGYLFYSEMLIGEIISLSIGVSYPAINSSQIWDIKIPIPSPAEQTAIANYLDCKTAEIDKLIADKKRLLELYEEEKTTIINQAVTKGINSDAPMKDSGIEWLGEIPEHWEVKRLKYVASINDEVLSEKTDEDYEIEYVEISGVKSGIGIVETTDYRFKDAPSRARRIARDGDVLVSTVRTYLKSVAKVDNPPMNLIVSTGFAVVRPKNINSDYTGYLFYSEMLIGEIISLSTGVSYPAINSNQIGDIRIPNLPLSEQQSIVRHIETECGKIDVKIGRTEKLIALLTEYRTALISEVVTGKIKVTN